MLQDIYNSRMMKDAGKITADPGHHLFQTLPSGRRSRAIKASTARHADSFFPPEDEDNVRRFYSKQFWSIPIGPFIMKYSHNVKDS